MARPRQHHGRRRFPFIRSLAPLLLITALAACSNGPKHPELTRLVTVIPDTGQRYLSGELFGDRPVAEEPVREHRLDDATIAMLEEHRDRLEFLS